MSMSNSSCCSLCREQSQAGMCVYVYGICVYETYTFTTGFSLERPWWTWCLTCAARPWRRTCRAIIMAYCLLITVLNQYDALKGVDMQGAHSLTR
jgi:hypothetical protein